MNQSFFVSAARGVNALLQTELQTLGIGGIRESRSGVHFQAPLEAAYRVCLWSRLANRVFLEVATFDCSNADELYAGIRAVYWGDHLQPEGSLAVDFSGRCAGIRNSHFGALKVKDAVVDQFRERCGQRPRVDTGSPDLRIHVYLHGPTASVHIDLSGDSLHRRGYRERGTAAPLKENIAAAMLQLGRWPEIAAAGGEFLDPMCGSGTLAIEAAMMAADRAPGLLRVRWGFSGWNGHQAECWQNLVEQAQQRSETGLQSLPVIRAFDIDARAVRSAQANIESAGLQERIHVERRPIEDARPSQKGICEGLVAVNPPYGERLNNTAEVAALYAQFGEVLKTRFSGWRLAMLVSDPELGFRLGIRSRRPYTLFNGALECRLLTMAIDPNRFFVPRALSESSVVDLTGAESPVAEARRRAQSANGEARDFVNRLRKNLRHTGRWARREQVSCYRLYDADLPDYALAIDVYGGGPPRVYVQEYQAPASIDAATAEQRLINALASIPEVLEVEWENIHLRVRKKQRGSAQYEKQDQSGRFHEVSEGGLRFLVNFEDYLDTGLFLDHRLTRELLREHARGRAFLNLFGYTGSATVYAASGGATSSTTVDMSRTYLDWAGKNFALNGMNADQHVRVQANVLEWLQPGSARWSTRYGLIFVDPPTFSNSSSMADTFDVQRDHTGLLRAAARLLEPGGMMVFSTNCRRFKLDTSLAREFQITDISRKTLPADFGRNQRIHFCWILRPAARTEVEP